ncbi:MAG: aminotransferase class V-fold PLP-dependent enzyme [Ruminococcaceae bacterium]|nr:aminotransferase class V-fold PLP-dependent enzyme [Oscillospiraceae bacterium]
MVYLDNSATTFIKPQNVKNAVYKAVKLYSVNPGRGNYEASAKAQEEIYKVRKEISEFFGGYGAENTVFLNSCTTALNQVLFGLLREGDHCVISDLEHNAVLRPLFELKKRGVEFTVAETLPYDNDKTVESFRKSIKKNTKLIVCTAASNVWGIRMPFERIAALSKLYEIKICVDASQAAGIIPINMRESMIDFLCFPAHKSLYGITGLGVLMLKEDENLNPLIFGGTGVNSISENQPLLPPERYESGTLNVPGIFALGEGLRFIKSKGLKNIHKYETDKLKYLYEFLSKMKGVTLYTKKPDTENSVPVLSFNTNLNSEEAVKLYSDFGIALRGGLHCAPLAHKKFSTENKGAVRVSPSVFTSDREIEYFVKVSGKIMKNNY